MTERDTDSDVCTSGKSEKMKGKMKMGQGFASVAGHQQRKQHEHNINRAAAYSKL